MRKGIILLLLLLAGLNIQAQRKGLSVTAGMADYNFAELKAYQDDLISRVPFDVKGFSYFPRYSNFRLSYFLLQDNGLKLGLVYAYSTTGAHANYKDLSGQLNIDQFVTAYQFGISGSYPFIGNGKFDLSGYGDLRLAYVRNQVNMNIVTLYYFESNTLKMKTFSPGLEAGLELNYNINRISFGLQGGYYLDSGSSFDIGTESLSDPLASLKTTSELHSQLSGFRAGIKLTFWLDPPQMTIIE